MEKERRLRSLVGKHVKLRLWCYPVQRAVFSRDGRQIEEMVTLPAELTAWSGKLEASPPDLFVVDELAFRLSDVEKVDLDGVITINNM